MSVSVIDHWRLWLDLADDESLSPAERQEVRAILSSVAQLYLAENIRRRAARPLIDTSVTS